MNSVRAVNAGALQAAEQRPEAAAAAAGEPALPRVPGLSQALAPGLGREGAGPPTCGRKRRRGAAAAAADELLQHDGRFHEADVAALAEMVRAIRNVLKPVSTVNPQSHFY